MFNDTVYKEVKFQLMNTENIKIDVTDEELKKIIDIATEDSEYEFLLTKDGLEYWNPRYLDFFKIIDGKWNNEDVYFWYDPFIEFHSDLHDYYNGSLKQFLIEFIDNTKEISFK